MRLDKFLSVRTMYSRKELHKYIESGCVTRNGVPMKQANFSVSDKDTIALNGVEIPGTTYVYILLNKPEGYVCSVDEPGQKLAIDLIPPTLQRKVLQPVGRLDKDSTGMLLFTDDGQLSHQVLSNRSHCDKYYHVTLSRSWKQEYTEQIAAGIVLKDGTHCLPAHAEPIPRTTHEMLICLHEGKYHQVRRMMAALGNHVEKLSRIAIGDLPIPPDLAIGACQVLNLQDVQKILKKETNLASMLQILRKNS